MINKLEEVEKRFETVNDLVCQPDVIADLEQYTKLMKELLFLIFCGHSLIQFHHFFRKKRNLVNKALAQCALGCQKLCRVDRLKNQNITVAKGTNWVSVTAAFVKYLVENEEYITKTFSHSYCGDEVFLQTML